MKRLAVFLLILALASQACALDFNPPPIVQATPNLPATSTPVIVQPTLSSTPIPATPTETVVPPSETPTTGLTLDQLRNASVELSGTNDHRKVQLTDGAYKSGDDTSASDYVQVSMGDKVAYGDLNGDGQQDAAIIIGENYGGSGDFVSVVAMLNQDGQPVFASASLIDDRPMINNLSIQNGEILVDGMIHGPNDPMCCPGMPSTRNLRLWDGKLIISRLTTKTPDGIERVISIDTPANGSEVSGQFAINGTVTVSPFENTLAYAVFLSGTADPVVKSSFTITGDGLGGPGTFELPLDFTAAGIKGPIRVEISDISAADGSYLSLATLYLVVK